MENTFVLDFETTGLNPYHDEIIEIAIKPYGKEEIYTKLTKPLIKKKLNYKVVEITKITDQLLAEKGINIYTAFNEMVNFMIEHITDKKAPIYLLAHNGTMFDFILLQRLFVNAHKLNPLSENIIEMFYKFVYIDTLLLSRLIIPNRYTYSQNALAKTFLINQKAEHRAYGDVMVLEEIFAKLIKDYCNRNSLDYQKCLDIKYVHALLYTYSFD